MLNKLMKAIGYVPSRDLTELEEKVHILKTLSDSATCALSRKAVKKIFGW